MAAVRATIAKGKWTRKLPKLPAGTWAIRYRSVDKAGNAVQWLQRTQPMR